MEYFEQWAREEAQAQKIDAAVHSTVHAFVSPDNIIDLQQSPTRGIKASALFLKFPIPETNLFLATCVKYPDAARNTPFDMSVKELHQDHHLLELARKRGVKHIPSILGWNPSASILHTRFVHSDYVFPHEAIATDPIGALQAAATMSYDLHSHDIVHGDLIDLGNMIYFTLPNGSISCTAIDFGIGTDLQDTNRLVFESKYYLKTEFNSLYQAILNQFVLKHRFDKLTEIEGYLRTGLSPAAVKVIRKLVSRDGSLDDEKELVSLFRKETAKSRAQTDITFADEANYAQAKAKINALNAKLMAIRTS